MNTRSHIVRSTQYSKRSRLILVIAVCGVTVLAVQGSARATGRSTSGSSLRSTTPLSRALSAAICKNVSAASVSAIVGYTVPAPTYYSIKEPATKKNFYISGVSGSCTYGKETSLAMIMKAVTLDVEITSKPFTAAELKEEISSVESTSKLFHFKIKPYSGLGTPAFYFSLSEAGYFGQGISSISGTTFFGASVSNKNISISKIASLAKLAEKL